MGRTAPLTSKRCILYIYSTNIGNEYFKHALYSPFFFSSKCSLFHNANLFGSYIIHILYTGGAKIKKNNSGAKRLRWVVSPVWRITPCRLYATVYSIYSQRLSISVGRLFYPQPQKSQSNGVLPFSSQWTSRAIIHIHPIPSTFVKERGRTVKHQRITQSTQLYLLQKQYLYL